MYSSLKTFPQAPQCGFSVMGSLNPAGRRAALPQKPSAGGSAGFAETLAKRTATWARNGATGGIGWTGGGWWLLWIVTAEAKEAEKPRHGQDTSPCQLCLAVSLSSEVTALHAVSLTIFPSDLPSARPGLPILTALLPSAQHVTLTGSGRSLRCMGDTWGPLPDSCSPGDKCQVSVTLRKLRALLCERGQEKPLKAEVFILREPSQGHRCYTQNKAEKLT